MYKISIILPTFNVENYLDRAFNSLLNQTIGFSNIQIIFVDDCSTDNSRKIIDEYSRNYSNVISLHLAENSGAAGKPRNEGIKYAVADYLIFLDPDDYLFSDSCEMLYNKITESNADMVVGGYAKNKDWTIRWSSWSEYDESLILNPTNNLSIFLNAPGLTAKIFKKELILKNKIKFPEKIPGQDLVFVTECFMNSKSIVSLNYFIVYCYFHLRKDEKSKSITNNVTERYLYNLLTAYLLTLNLLLKFKVDNNLIKIYFTMHHLPFFISQIKKFSGGEDKIKKLLESDDFKKFVNQDYILQDKKLSNIIEKLIFDNKSIDVAELKPIWQNTRDKFVKSNNFVPELEYISDNNLKKTNVESIPSEINIQKMVKKLAQLNNYLIDSSELK